MTAPALDQSAVGPMPAHLEDRSDPDKAHHDYIAAVTDAIVNHPRSLQRAIGPSEIGDPCSRRIAYKLLGVPERPRPPAWRPTVGTAGHAWMETVFDGHNVTHLADLDDQERYLVETKLAIAYVKELEPSTGTPWLAGSCDLYDRVTATSIDHKFVGPNKLKHYKRVGPGPDYRVQAHLYGLGWRLRGWPVDQVAACFLPRDGELSDHVWWSESYDEQVARAAIERLRGIALIVNTLGADAPAALPTEDAHCTFCDWYRTGPVDLAQGCPGHGDMATNRAAAQLDGLI